MKKTLFFALGLSTMITFAQTGNVGVNTDSPRATLDLEVASINKSNNTNQGIIAPKMSKNRVAEITTPVEGTLVYVVDEDTINHPNSQISAYTGTNEEVKNITTKGYYYYDGALWVRGVAPEKYYRGVNTGNVNTTWITPGGVLHIQSDEKIRYVGEGEVIYLEKGENKLPEQQTHTMNNSSNIINDMKNLLTREHHLLDCIPVDLGYSLQYDNDGRPTTPFNTFTLGHTTNLNYGANIDDHDHLLRCHIFYNKGVFTALVKVNLSWFKKADTTIDFTDDNVLYRPQNMP